MKMIRPLWEINGFSSLHHHCVKALSRSICYLHSKRNEALLVGAGFEIAGRKLISQTFLTVAPIFIYIFINTTQRVYHHIAHHHDAPPLR